MVWNNLEDDLDYLCFTKSNKESFDFKNVFQNISKVSFLSPYPDICAFAISMILTVILCLGVKKSTRFNNIFTILNISVVVFVTIAGFIKADPANWTLQKEDLPTDKE